LTFNMTLEIPAERVASPPLTCPIKTAAKMSHEASGAVMTMGDETPIARRNFSSRPVLLLVAPC
jgi:hypothetical protein